MASLTEQLDALIAKHDLASICISRLKRSDDDTSFWSVGAQAETPQGREIGTSGYEIADAGEALAAAIADLNTKRIAPAEVVDLAPMQVAA